jgi:hypothetical protein
VVQNHRVLAASFEALAFEIGKGVEIDLASATAFP